jgi:adenosine deaminase
MDRVNDLARVLPKTELHLHIEGTFEVPLMYKIAERNNITLACSQEEITEKRKNFVNLQDFLDLYYEACSVLLKEEDFYDLCLEYLDRAIQD